MDRKYFLRIVFESSYQIQVNSCFTGDKAEKVDGKHKWLPMVTKVSGDLEYIFSEW